jgi:hypothetical protein
MIEVVVDVRNLSQERAMPKKVRRARQNEIQDMVSNIVSCHHTKSANLSIKQKSTQGGFENRSATKEKELSTKYLIGSSLAYELRSPMMRTFAGVYPVLLLQDTNKKSD